MNGSIVCQHGEDECTFNRWEVCILEHAGKKALKTIICVENELKNNPETGFDADLAKCFKTLGVPKGTQKAIA